MDGSKYSKYGTSVPPIVSDSLNIKELVLNNNKEQLNFWDQMNYPFLLDKTPVELFRFIIDSGDDDQISQALKNMVSDRQLLSKDIDLLQGSINLLDQEIETFNKELEEAKPKIEVSDKILDLQPKVARLGILQQALLTLQQINQRKKDIVDTYNKVQREVSIYTEMNSTLSIMTQRYAIITDNFVILHSIICNLSDVVEEIEQLPKLDDLSLPDTSELSRMKEIKKTINYISKQKESLQDSPVISGDCNLDEVDKLTMLKGNLDLHKMRDYQLINLNESIIANNLSKELYNELKGLFDICPVCGNKIH